MNNMDNMEIPIEEILNKIEFKLNQYNKFNNIKFKKLKNNEKKELMIKINNEILEDLYKNDM